MTENHKHDADVAFIKALAELLRENDLTELHVKREYGDDNVLNVRVSRIVTVAAPPAPVIATPAQLSATHTQLVEPDDPANHPGVVTSPMVGTVYLQPEPESEPFIKVGESVTEGQTLMIVEAMKTMNHIPSPRAGVIRRILVEDGAPVEYGAPLVIVD